MPIMKTEPMRHSEEVNGYLINSSLSETGKDIIEKLQNVCVKELQNSIWCTPPETLHITLMDWFAPLVKYDTHPDKLFSTHFPQYDNVMLETIERQKCISVHFNKIRVSQKAIFIQGEDDGSYSRIRTNFLQKVTLLPETKRPPKIIHSTIACFTKEIDFETVSNFIESLTIDFIEDINDFRLVNELQTPMQKYNILKRYGLRKK